MKYRMPAEWEPHEATWLTWPRNKITWPGALLKRVEEIYIQMMRGLLPGEKVNLLVPDEKTAKSVVRRLEAKNIPSKNLIFHKVKTVDVWIRDYGPIFVKRIMDDRSWIVDSSTIHHPPSTIQLAFTKWIFNSWGGKYSDLARDTRVVDKIEYFKNFYLEQNK